MLIHRLDARGLLSFGPQGINLDLRPLNVLIGPSGSGKSNLLDVRTNGSRARARADLLGHAGCYTLGMRDLDETASTARRRSLAVRAGLSYTR